MSSYQPHTLSAERVTRDGKRRWTRLCTSCPGDAVLYELGTRALDAFETPRLPLASDALAPRGDDGQVIGGGW